MLRVRHASSTDPSAWRPVGADRVLTGLQEDCRYHVAVDYPGPAVFVDDVRLEAETPTVFRWCPAFYAGRVIVDVVRPDQGAERYFFDINPNPAKSGQEEFDAMVADIRQFDERLMSGTSSATMAFGRQGYRGQYQWDILLSRLREHGPAFLDAVESICKLPHRSLSSERKLLPLSQIRRLHHSCLLDRKLVSMATGATIASAELDSFQLSALTSSPTFDTPANRALFALVSRFSAVTRTVVDAVQSWSLGAPREEQELRAPRRLLALDSLFRRARSSLRSPLFRQVSSSQTTAAGLTQIAAQPVYSRAYRLGSRALASQLAGADSTDNLHIPPSWGIYETWCFLAVVRAVEMSTGMPAVKTAPSAVFADEAMSFNFPGGLQLEVLFQAKFVAVDTKTNRLGQSISSERRPDIVLVLHSAQAVRTMILDAKWRSQRHNILQAMESAHIYHDALRVAGARPSSCILLLPGKSEVPDLERSDFLAAHSVGVLSNVRIGGDGLNSLTDRLSSWLSLGDSGA